MAEQEQSLRDASSQGDTAAVTKLLESGTAQKGDESGDTPLHLATSNYITDPNHVEVVRLLLDAGGSVNVTNQNGDAPIHKAAANGHLEIVELLIEYESPLDTEGEMGMVPIGLAAMKKHHAVVNCLLIHLLEGNKFTEKQVHWISKVESEIQQLNLFRALSSIFAQRKAVDAFNKFNVIGTIMDGLKKFSKKSVHTAGLSLINTMVACPSGKESAKSLNVKDTLPKICEQHMQDPVVAHLVEEIRKSL